MIYSVEDTWKLVSSGDSCRENNNLDRALHYYNQALRIEPSSAEINRKLAETYLLKAESGKDNSKTFCRLAMECCRRVIAAEPANESAHNQLIVLAKKLCLMDEVISEYKEKIKKEQNEELTSLYNKCIKEISLLSTFDDQAEEFRRKTRFIPDVYMRFVFDFILLPSSVLLIVLSVFVSRFRPVLLPSIGLFFFYVLS